MQYFYSTLNNGVELLRAGVLLAITRRAARKAVEMQQCGGNVPPIIDYANTEGVSVLGLEGRSSQPESQVGKPPEGR